MKFGTILADPPWLYSSRSVGIRGTTSHHYSTLSIEDLKSLPVSDVTEDAAVLLLWATWPQLPEALSLIDAWGFKYVTAVPWLKTVKDGIKHDAAGDLLVHPNYGVGYWFRGCTEVLLLAKTPAMRAIRTNLVGIISPNAEHSRKPQDVYDIAERFPGPHLELFARNVREGWESVGDHLDGEDIRTSLQLIRDDVDG